MKKLLKKAAMPLRLLTARWRKLPDFMILGVQKGGTTSLFHYLQQHPQLKLSKPKEVHFFDDQYRKGLSFYRAHFPFKTDKRITGEATPYYFNHPGVKFRIKENLSQTRFIVVLRDPVERAYSHYQMQLRAGVEHLQSFEEALDAEQHRIKGEFERMCDDYLYDSINFKRFSYVERGYYFKYLSSWFREYSRDQFLILKSEDLSENPKRELKKVYDFLGLNENYPRILKKKHVGRYDEINPDTKEYLRQLYKEDQEKLVSLLGPSFFWE